MLRRESVHGGRGEDGARRKISERKVEVDAFGGREETKIAAGYSET